MKKVDRLNRASERAARLNLYQRQEDALQSFFDECKSAMTADAWARHYSEARQSAGETFHIFEFLIFELGTIQVPINPRLRKSIDAVLNAYKIKRDNCPELRKLNYDSFWREQYGYQ